MSKFKSLLACLVLLASASASMPAAAELKIISIRSAELLAASPKFKSGQESIKSEFEPRSKALEAEAKSLAEDVEKFKREADLMSGEARAKKEKDLQNRRIDFEYKRKQFAEDFQKRDRELSQELTGEIKKFVVQVAEEKGADLVLQDPVFAAAGVDVTDEVIKRMQSGKK